MAIIIINVATYGGENQHDFVTEERIFKQKTNNLKPKATGNKCNARRRTLHLTIRIMSSQCVAIVGNNTLSIISRHGLVIGSTLAEHLEALLLPLKPIMSC